ncbi:MULTISPECIES: hypothetical protein [unclassified Ruegeria]|uniref:hypothetical protein n=1 Tax=unclassified Ruegeria TaxID=2625375 RepID=UPI0014876FC3|nr:MULTISPECIES: hypothetical protein [unclassified Ruegeria]
MKTEYKVTDPTEKERILKEGGIADQRAEVFMLQNGGRAVGIRVETNEGKDLTYFDWLGGVLFNRRDFAAA